MEVRVPSAGADLRVPLSMLDGVRVTPRHVALYASSGDVLELDGEGLGGFGDMVRATACCLPELTLGLRGLGSARGYPGMDHDRFFAPVLAARRAAERATDPAGRLAAMRAAALGAEVERVLHELAVARYPDNPAERRALETALEDLSAPIRTSLLDLDTAARDATAASDDAAFVWWRAWTDQCRALLQRIDQCWLALAPLLRRTPLSNRATARKGRGREKPTQTERDA